VEPRLSGGLLGVTHGIKEEKILWNKKSKLKLDKKTRK